ncbi:hypothetical protein [Novosphingobium cyanobacteriorum]|uniref:Uncharacterized protein n=1 Tax=Novosphingobium cyanobacteriorum TaxID=3024215 RepID=A0ABT6CHG8_9SPHN|nr:hypothetical protein [Novosphingobium cyanobacteriorum]MDF8332733.1 hypothetical protein [Novosphingobium cyanobacteriorum]
MTFYPEFQPSRLREIVWNMWDPIGLADGNGRYGADCADEYDSYLLQVVSQLCNGRSRDEVAAYLVDIATEHIGLGDADPNAAAATANAISNYLTSLPDGPKAVR